MLTLLFKLIAALPLPVVHRLGAMAGWLAYALSARYRQRLRANLAQAGLDAPALRRAAIAQAGCQALETPWIWLRPASRLLRLIGPEDLARMKAAQADGPTLFLTPHLGCFEIIPKVYAAHVDARTRSMTVLYRVPRKQVLRPWVESGRAQPGIVLAPADMRGVRLLMRAMKERQTAGILPDQVPSGGEGVWAPFFGRPAYTMTLPARLARSYEARIVFVYGERLPLGAGYRIRVAPFTGSLSGDPVADAAQLNAALEALVRACPQQYLWGYNRYKAPPGHAAAKAAA